VLPVVGTYEFPLILNRLCNRAQIQKFWLSFAGCLYSTYRGMGLAGNSGGGLFFL